LEEFNNKAVSFCTFHRSAPRLASWIWAPQQVFKICVAGSSCITLAKLLHGVESQVLGGG
jgi:hypothetical protein